MEETEKVQKRRWWVSELNRSRDEDGFYAKSFEKIKEEDPKHFSKITRMSPQAFDALLALVEPRLGKTSWRRPIEPSARLFLVLLYLSQGLPKQVLTRMFRMGYATVANIIYETCDVLWEVLRPIYMSPPDNDDWREMAAEFEAAWDLPNCVAAIDGRHINIRSPSEAGSGYCTKKGLYSIVLLAICDANYVFTAVDIGTYESQSDGAIFAESSFGRKAMAGDLDLPPPRLLPNSNTICHHFIVGDVTFPLKTHLMRPYPGRLLDDEKSNFNKRLLRARRVIENAFGILVAKWRILETTLNMLPTNADKVVKAVVVLHDFVKLNDPGYCSSEFIDTCNADGDVISQGLWRKEASALRKSRPIGSNNATKAAFKMRDELKAYLYANRI